MEKRRLGRVGSASWKRAPLFPTSSVMAKVCERKVLNMRPTLKPTHRLEGDAPANQPAIPALNLLRGHGGADWDVRSRERFSLRRVCS